MNIYEECKKYFSNEYQLTKMIEELGELTQATAKYNNNKTPENLERVIEEMADVHITMNHIRYRFNTYHREEAYQLDKIKRLTLKIQDLESKKDLYSR